MKHAKTRFLILCSLVILGACSLAPMMTNAHCPTQTVQCGNKLRECSGTQQGDQCVYSASCLNCGGAEMIEEVGNY
jgi:hypothetical protein